MDDDEKLLKQVKDSAYHQHITDLHFAQGLIVIYENNACQSWKVAHLIGQPRSWTEAAIERAYELTGQHPPPLAPMYYTHYCTNCQLYRMFARCIICGRQCAELKEPLPVDDVPANNPPPPELKR